MLPNSTREIGEDSNGNTKFSLTKRGCLLYTSVAEAFQSFYKKFSAADFCFRQKTACPQGGESTSGVGAFQKEMCIRDSSYPVTPVESGGIFFHVLIQLVQVNVRQYRTDNSALRHSAVRPMKSPLFQITRPEELPDKPYEPFVGDTFLQDINQNIMIDIVEETFYISFDEPLPVSYTHLLLF